MAWIDDRIWCHPKFTDLSADAFATYVRAVAYSSGMGTEGRLTRQQQQLIGTTLKVKRELVRARLWIETVSKPGENTRQNSSEIEINDWKEHNGKRDARRAADRERKRLARAAEREASAGQGADKPADNHADKPADRRALTGDGSEGSERKTPTPNPAVDVEPPPADEQPDDADLEWHAKTRAVA